MPPASPSSSTRLTAASAAPPPMPSAAALPRSRAGRRFWSSPIRPRSPPAASITGALKRPWPEGALCRAWCRSTLPAASTKSLACSPATASRPPPAPPLLCCLAGKVVPRQPQSRRGRLAPVPRTGRALRGRCRRTSTPSLHPVTTRLTRPCESRSRMAGRCVTLELRRVIATVPPFRPAGRPAL